MPIEMGTDKIKKLQKLRDRGTISTEEYLRVVEKFVHEPSDTTMNNDEAEGLTENSKPDQE